LASNNCPGEWYVAFHGLNIENYKIMHQVISNIMKIGFIEGYKQTYKDSKCLKTGKKVGVGIYCTPNIETAKGYT
jgi:hypothetical protein